LEINQNFWVAAELTSSPTVDEETVSRVLLTWYQKVMHASCSKVSPMISAVHYENMKSKYPDK